MTVISISILCQILENHLSIKLSQHCLKLNIIGANPFVSFIKGRKASFENPTTTSLEKPAEIEGKVSSVSTKLLFEL